MKDFSQFPLEWNWSSGVWNGPPHATWSHSKKQRAYKKVKFITRFAAVTSYAFSLNSYFFPILTQTSVILREAVLYHLLFSLFSTEHQESMIWCYGVCVCMYTYTYTCTCVCTFVSGSWTSPAIATLPHNTCVYAECLLIDDSFQNISLSHVFNLCCIYLFTV